MRTEGIDRNLDAEEASTIPRSATRSDEGGFTLVELVVAIMILAIGLLGLAGTTGFVVRQTTLAEVTTERSMALQSVVEAIRAQPYASLGSGSTDVGPIQASWSVVATGANSTTLRVITVGPGVTSAAGVPAVGDQVADTTLIRRIAY